MNDNIRNRAIADSRLFSYDFLTNTFSTDASILMVNGIDPVAQLYCDACDQGFQMQSAKTSRIVKWYLTLEHRDRENDITHWEFAPTFDSIHYNPKLKDAHVYVWNT